MPPLGRGPSAGWGRHVLTLGLVGVSALSLVGNVVFSRLLGRPTYGAVGSVLALASLLAVPLSAIQSAVTRQVAVAGPRGVARARPTLFSALGAVAVVAVAVLALPALDRLLHLRGDAVVVLLGAYLGSIVLEGVPRGYLVGERRYAAVGAVVLAGAALRLGLGWGWAALRPDAVGPLAGAAAGEGATALALVALLSRRRGAPTSLRGGTEHPRRRLALARPGRQEVVRRRAERLRVREVGLSMAGFTGLLSLMSIDTVAARHWLSAVGSGYYAAASAAGSIAYFLAAAVATSVFPDVARGAAARDRHQFLLGLAEVALVATAAAAILAAAAPWVVEIVFGSRYGPAAAPLRLLACSYALLGVLAYLVGHHLAHRSRSVLLPWAGSGVLVAALFAAHGSPTVVALDALAASASLLCLLGTASVRLERGTKGLSRPAGR